MLKEKKDITGVKMANRTPLVFVFFILISQAHYLCAQTIPPHRKTDWQVAGATYPHFNTTPVIDVTNFGAVGDGATDNHTAINDAINQLSGLAGTIYFPAGHYLINGSVNLPDSVTLKGSGADSTVLLFNAGSHSHAITITGAASGTFVPVVDGLNKNSMQLILSDTMSLASGDMAELIQDGHLHMTSSWAMNSLGQMLVIDSVCGHILFLKQPLRMDYDSILNPRLRKVTARKGVSIECLKIKRLDSTIQQTANIRFLYAQDCRIIGVESRLCNFAHVDIRKSTNITVKNSFFHEGHDYGNGGKAYGVCIHASSGACLVENNIFKQLRHAMLLQSGANGNVFAYNYSKDPFWTDVLLPANSAGDMVLHGNYPYLNLFEGNIGQHIVIDDSHGKNGPHNTFFRNRAELYGIFMNNNPPSDSINFVGNEVTNTGFLMGLYFLNGANHLEHGNNIKGNITPAGTTNLPELSYFYEQKPAYWHIPDAFPPIGPPATIDSYMNPAKARYLSGANLTLCCDSTLLTHVVRKTGDYGTKLLKSCRYNATINSIEINYISTLTPVPTNITVYNTTGQPMTHKTLTPDSSLNQLYVSMPENTPTGVYIIRSHQHNKAATCKVFILNK